MASITHIDVEVRPSIGFQTVGYTARVQFDEPLDAVEALARVADVREMLTEQAHRDIEGLVAHRQSSETEQRAQAPQAPQPMPTATASGDGWAIANKPKGGTFRYMTTAAYPTDQFKQAIVGQLAGLGIDASQVDVFDDRVGNYGLESGNTGYTAGKVKVKDGTPLASAMGGKSIIAGADFDNSGAVKVVLSRDGKAALQAMTIAQNIKQLDATPF